MATDQEDKALLADLSTLARLNQLSIEHQVKQSDRIEGSLEKILTKVEESRREIDLRMERCKETMQKDIEKAGYVKQGEMTIAITEASKEDRAWHSKQMAKYGIGIVSVLSLVFAILTYFKA